MNQQEFASHIGKTPQYVSKLKNNGRLVIENGEINVEATLKLIDETADPSKIGVVERNEIEKEKKASASAPGPVSGAERLSVNTDDLHGRAGSAYQQARAMTEKYKAMQAKLDYDKAVGQLLVASEVNAAVADGDLIVCERIEAMLYALASQLEGVQGEQKRLNIMLEHWEAIRTEISRSFYRMAKP